MRPEQTADGEQIKPISEDGIARMYWLAFVCVLSLFAGGAGAFALYHARQGAAEVEGVAEERVNVGLDAKADAAAPENLAAEDARAGGGETVAADEAEDETGVSVRDDSRHEARVRARARVGERAGRDARATRRYARASGRQVAAGGPGVGGRALGGVKKTGEGVKKTGTVIGKTVGKIGGIFHD